MTDAENRPATAETAQAGVTFQPVRRVLDHGQSDEDLMRADVYGLLAELFAEPPADAFFNRLASSPMPEATTDAEGDVAAESPPLTLAWADVIARAGALPPLVVREEFKTLFVAVGKPDIVANASFYRNGALNGQALVDLRASLAGLGLERDPNSAETEDHFSAVCEVMRFLVAGELDESGPPRDLLATQHAFFNEHLSPWVFDFFATVEQHRASDFYAAVVRFAQAFFEIERQAFDIYAASQGE